MKKIEICAPAGNLPSLKAAVDNGADAVYMGFSGDTNLRNFPALNFTEDEVYKAIQYAHSRKRKVYITVNAYPQEKELPLAYNVVDRAYEFGADAVIASDIAVLFLCQRKVSGEEGSPLCAGECLQCTGNRVLQETLRDKKGSVAEGSDCR